MASFSFSKKKVFIHVNGKATEEMVTSELRKMKANVAYFFESDVEIVISDHPMVRVIKESKKKGIPLNETLKSDIPAVIDKAYLKNILRLPPAMRDKPKIPAILLDADRMGMKIIRYADFDRFINPDKALAKKRQMPVKKNDDVDRVENPDKAVVKKPQVAFNRFPAPVKAFEVPVDKNDTDDEPSELNQFLSQAMDNPIDEMDQYAFRIGLLNRKRKLDFSDIGEDAHNVARLGSFSQLPSFGLSFSSPIRPRQAVRKLNFESPSQDELRLNTLDEEMQSLEPFDEFRAKLLPRKFGPGASTPLRTLHFGYPGDIDKSPSIASAVSNAPKFRPLMTSDIATQTTISSPLRYTPPKPFKEIQDPSSNVFVGFSKSPVINFEPHRPNAVNVAAEKEEAEGEN